MVASDVLVGRTSSVTEIYKLVRQGITSDIRDGSPYSEAMAKLFGVETNEPKLFTLIAFSAARVQQAKKDVQRCSIPDQQKTEAVGALESIESVFLISAVGANWLTLKQSGFNQLNERSLFYLFPTIEREFPLPLLTEEDKKHIFSEINLALSELTNDEALSIFIRDVLFSVQNATKHYGIVGERELFERSIFAYQCVETERKRSSRKMPTLTRLSAALLGLIFAIAGGIIYTNDLIEASDDWIRRAGKILDYFQADDHPDPIKLPSSKLLALPPPPRQISYSPNEEIEG